MGIVSRISVERPSPPGSERVQRVRRSVLDGRGIARLSLAWGVHRPASMAIGFLLAVLSTGSPAFAQEPYEMPKVLPYEPGHEVPAGYHREERPRRGLLIAGTAIFGGFYAVSALSALAAKDAAFSWLAVPWVGPIAAMATYERCGSSDIFCADGPVDLLLVFLELGQVFGTFMFVEGLDAGTETFLVRDPPEAAARQRTWDVRAPAQCAEGATG
jgi:hypothetical protein